MVYVLSLIVSSGSSGDNIISRISSLNFNLRQLVPIRWLSNWFILHLCNASSKKTGREGEGIRGEGIRGNNKPWTNSSGGNTLVPRAHSFVLSEFLSNEVYQTFYKRLGFGTSNLATLAIKRLSLVADVALTKRSKNLGDSLSGDRESMGGRGIGSLASWTRVAFLEKSTLDKILSRKGLMQSRRSVFMRRFKVKRT